MINVSMQLILSGVGQCELDPNAAQSLHALMPEQRRVTTMARTKGNNPSAGTKATHPRLGESDRAEVNRPIGAGPAHRGDRRDTSPTYTGNAKHAARGNTPRKDVKTR